MIALYWCIWIRGGSAPTMKAHQSMPVNPPQASPPIHPDAWEILHAIPHASFLHRSDNGRILFANRAAETLLGYRAEAWQAMGIVDIEWTPSVHVPAPAGEFAKRTGHVKHRDGTKIPVEVSSQRMAISEGEGVLTVFRDLSQEHKATQRLVRQQEFRQQALRLSLELLESGVDLADAVPEALRKISDVLDADIVSITKLSHDGAEVQPWHTWAHRSGVVELLHRIAPLGTAPNLARVLLEQGSFQAHEDSWPPGWIEQSVVREAGISSSLYVLLEKRADTLVFFSADTFGRRSEWSPVAVDQIRLAGKLLLDAIERRTAHATLSKALDGTILAFARTTEARDPFTAGHQERVTRLALAIGQRLGLADIALETLRVAAMLHDIGKLSIPAEFLARPGKLTQTERRLVESHTQVGYEILTAAALPWSIADIVHQHHERLDGSGYPSGLGGKDMMLEARILAVADVVEAMCSHRPYRPALGVDAALAEIRDGLGTRYDRSVADACFAAFAHDFHW